MSACGPCGDPTRCWSLGWCDVDVAAAEEINKQLSDYPCQDADRSRCPMLASHPAACCEAATAIEQRAVPGGR